VCWHWVLAGSLEAFGAALEVASEVVVKGYDGDVDQSVSVHKRFG